MFQTESFLIWGEAVIEMIHIENYKIKKIICLNLGVLRLSEKFVKFNEKLEEETRYKHLEDYLYKHMPTIEQFDFDSSMDTRLVGIGGTVRTLYKFISGIFKILHLFHIITLF